MATHLLVNGSRVELDSPPGTPLLWALRDELHCRSAKFGCGLEQCGACRVLIDDVPTASCQVSVGDLAGRSVSTLEQIATDPIGARVIDALLARNAGQCGYCLPGIVVTLTHLARRAEPVSRVDLGRALDPHLCRCGSQPRIMAAALDLFADRAGDGA